MVCALCLKQIINAVGSNKRYGTPKQLICQLCIAVKLRKEWSVKYLGMCIYVMKFAILKHTKLRLLKIRQLGLTAS